MLTGAEFPPGPTDTFSAIDLFFTSSARPPIGLPTRMLGRISLDLQQRLTIRPGPAERPEQPDSTLVGALRPDQDDDEQHEQGDQNPGGGTEEAHEISPSVTGVARRLVRIAGALRRRRIA